MLSLRKKKRPEPIRCSKKIMAVLNSLHFLLENEECFQGHREVVEGDMYPEGGDLMRISFLTDKDFSDAKSQGRERPADDEKKVAWVESHEGYCKFTFRSSGLNGFERRVIKLDDRSYRIM